MRWFATELGYGEDADFWATVGLLHDIDFEMWPEEHCVRCVALLEEMGATAERIHAVCSHAYGPCSDGEPVHGMEKVIFAAAPMVSSVSVISRVLARTDTNSMVLQVMTNATKRKKIR